ncbi:hypothetical protein H5410_005113 [Solanum commersonii]|uniref:Uncharacterized protein n=1 Tax=Solanum commersonii TaxID=4109 RepID=A0A9J6A774_SOLCO|nr:hypothetical protein H5410_005113 [Solanum commersonii]
MGKFSRRQQCSEILLFHIGKVIVGLVLAKVTLDFGYLFADDLTCAVNQFYSPPSGEGWFSQPPTLNPPPENFSLELIPGSEGEKLKKFHAVVEGHLRRYCASEDGLKRFPCFKAKNKKDFQYSVQYFSVTELDIETKYKAEITLLSAYLGPFRKIQTLFHIYFDKYFKSD